jgi:hypothetical protein
MQPRPDEAVTTPAAPASNEDNRDIGWGETLMAGLRGVRDDQWGHSDEERQGAYSGIVNSLVDMGYDVNRYVNPWAAQQLDYDQIWGDMEEARRRNPKAFASVPSSQAELEQRWQKDFAQRQARDARIIARGSMPAHLAGGILGSLTDPLNIGSMLATGGAATGWRLAAREAIVNGLTEAVEQPIIASVRREQGRKLTAGEAVANIALGAVTGAVGGPALHYGGKALGKGAAAAFDAVMPGKREGQAMLAQTNSLQFASVGGRDLIRAFEEAVPEQYRTPDQAAALNAYRRMVEVDTASPYAASHAGLSANGSRLQQGAQRVLGRGVDQPVSNPGAVQGFMARVGRAESPSDVARNPRSSATGRYQFTGGTWLRYYKARFGADGLTDRQILAKRTDGNLQDVLMRDLTADNVAALRRANVPITEGNLYLAHFAGEAGARKLHAADPNARAVDVLGEKAVKANPFLEKMTARDVIEWAHGKMGSRADDGVDMGAVGRSADTFDAEMSDVARQRAQLDADQAGLDGARVEDALAPPLARDRFDSDEAWEVAQREVDAEALGIVEPRTAPIERQADEIPDAVTAAGDGVDIAPMLERAIEVGAPTTREPVAPENADGEVAGALADVGRVIDEAEADLRASDPALAAEIGRVADEAAAALPRDLAMASRPHGVSETGEHLTGNHAFNGPDGRFLWNPATGEVSGAFPARQADAQAVRDYLGLRETNPGFRDAAVERFDDPTGKEADAQTEFLEHDLRMMADSGALDGVTFMALRDGTADRAANILARFDDDAKALEALRGCL